MACYNNYLPQPPRVWSRVQNRCSLEEGLANDSSLVQVPYSKLEVPGSTIGYYLAMLNKGNVLQYKANSSSLTKAQRYAKIAKGQWVNRNTTWATQSARGYTNPNTTSLKRGGNVINIGIDPVSGLPTGFTDAPVTCPVFVRPENPVIPINGGGGGTNNPVIPPPPPPNPSPPDNIIPVVTPVTPPPPIVIQDGGTLNCAEQENVCTGFVKRHLSQQRCNPTTDSDVPGQIELLCWNDGNPTWYPRQRYTMPTSGNKWPYNSNGITPYVSAIRPYPAVITSLTSNQNLVTLTWTQDETSLYVSYFDIYENGVPIKIVDGTMFTTDLLLDICSYEYSIDYYIVSRTSSNIESYPSNTVTFSHTGFYAPTITNALVNCDYITIFWTPPNVPCLDISAYNIYQDGVLVDTVSGSTSSLIINGLILYDTYAFNVAYIFNGIESEWSDTYMVYNVTAVPCTPTVAISNITSGQVSLVWTSRYSSSAPITYKIYQNGSFLINLPVTQPVPYIISGLTNGLTYSFYVTTVDTDSNESETSNTVSATLTIPDPPTSVTATSVSDTTNVDVSWVPPVADQNPPIAYYIVTPSSGSATGPIYNTSCTFTGLTSGTNYTFSVQTYNTYNIASSPSTGSNSVTIPYPINITVTTSNCNTSLSTPTGTNTFTSSSGAIVFTDPSSTFTINNIFSSISFNMLVVGPGGTGGSGGAGNGDAVFPAAGGGGGGGGSGGIVTITGLSITAPITFNVSVGQPASTTSSISTPPFFNTYCSANTGGNGGDGQDHTSGNPGGGGGGGSTFINGSIGGTGIAYNGVSGGGGDGASNTNGSNGTSSTGSNPYTFTVQSTGYNIIYGGGGGGGRTKSNPSYTGGASAGGNGGQAEGGSPPPQRKGYGGGLNLSAPNTIEVGGAGGGGASYGPSSSIYIGGTGSQGIVIVWWY